MSPYKHDAALIVVWAVFFGIVLLIANVVEWVVTEGAS